MPAANGATVIQWLRGDHVTGLQITGLDHAVSSTAPSNGCVNSSSTTDSNNNANLYDYTVGATHTTGKTAKHDPRIQDGG